MKLLNFIKNFFILILMIFLSTLAIYFIHDDILPLEIQMLFDKTPLIRIENLFQPSKEQYEEIDFDPLFYPYYHLLNENEQILYRQVYINVSNYTKVIVPFNQMNSDEVNNVMNAIFNDHPEFFWLETRYTIKKENDICKQLEFVFNDCFLDIETSKRLFDESTQKILDGAQRLSNDYEKEKYIHDALVNLISYNEDAISNQSAYSALVNHESVCAGYARAFQYLMMRLEIPTYYCTGYSNGEHAWNIIRIDHHFYNVDITWDDSTDSYHYFNKTDKYFKATHQRSDVSMKLPSCDID